jgi:3-oxoacyl-[acyl-carrier protein] reductase
MHKLHGKRVLVTAGAQGIGLAITRGLLAAGCKVYAHYHRSREAAENLSREHRDPPAQFFSGAADLTTTTGAAQVVDRAVTALGGLDILINNAGSLVARRSLSEIDDTFWNEVFSLNLASLQRITQAAAPHLIASAATNQGSSIVNLASLAGRRGGHAGSLAYATAKGAVLTYTRGLAYELGPRGVRVNAVAPGFIAGTSFHTTHTTPDAARKTIEGIPLGRAGNADDVARAVVFLASEYDGFIQGATLDINGGVYVC